MRRLAAVSILGAVCVLAPAAQAATAPPVGLSTIRAVKLAPNGKPAKSCAARPRSRSRAAAVRITRKLHPVACEQPPRSKVIDAGFVIVFAP